MHGKFALMPTLCEAIETEMIKGSCSRQSRTQNVTRALGLRPCVSCTCSELPVEGIQSSLPAWVYPSLCAPGGGEEARAFIILFSQTFSFSRWRTTLGHWKIGVKYKAPFLWLCGQMKLGKHRELVPLSHNPMHVPCAVPFTSLSLVTHISTLCICYSSSVVHPQTPSPQFIWCTLYRSCSWSLIFCMVLHSPNTHLYACTVCSGYLLVPFFPPSLQ